MDQPSRPVHETKPEAIAGIPCFNTDASIRDVVTRARQHVDQVFVIDDGSSDDTAEVASAAGARVISHPRNMGYGEALKSCFAAAEDNAADVLVVLDGDGQHNPDEIPRFLSPILDGDADLVIGSRFLTSEHNMPRYRRFGIKVITFLWNFGSKVKVSDAQSGFRAYRQNVLATIAFSRTGMSSSIEIIERARKKGVSIKEVPVSCLYVPSSINAQAVNHGLTVALAVIKIRLRSRLGG